MYDPVYKGWGNRTWLKGLVKGAFANARLQADAGQLEPTVRSVNAELKHLGLDSKDGVINLASIIAEDILKTFDENISNLEALYFHKHLLAHIASFLLNEGLFEIPGEHLVEPVETRSELWQLEARMRRTYEILINLDSVLGDVAQMFRWFASPIIEQFPQVLEADYVNSDDLYFNVDVPHMMRDLHQAVERMVTIPFAPEFDHFGHALNTRARLEYNVVLASGGTPNDPNALSKAKLPTKHPNMRPTELIDSFLSGTAFETFFNMKVPVKISQSTRFEHQHIVAGSGHGKTQTIQQLILHDLKSVIKGQASVIVIDSQGELIKNISNLAIFRPDSPLFDKLVVVDPTDVEYPVALNLFDVKMDRINEYSQLDREKMVNGILELYDFVLGSLLAAEMTQKQSVIFRYITRLMIQIPNATIATLRELLEEGGADKYREHINRLQGSARSFFETEFDSKEFVQTKKQVLRRLWGILENQSFERMFLHPRNKLDLFSEMNSGKVILINTAKDLLKEDGTEIFGRFFIAMIAQAAQERSVIHSNDRMPTYVYVDEAADYFDRNVGIILSQARKYKVGMILAHQYLGQLDSKLQEAVFTNTSIRLAGGVSSKDARALASEMKTDASFIESQKKLSMATFVRGTTQHCVSIDIEPGQMERLAKLSKEEKRLQRDHMRKHYCVHYTEAQNTDETVAGESPADEEDCEKRSVNGDENPPDNDPSDKKYPDEPGSW